MFNRRWPQGYIWGAAWLLIFDQLLKYFVSHRLASAGGGFFGYYLNRNFAWSLPLSNSWAIILSSGFLLSMVIYFFLKRQPSPLPIVWLASGALSNLLDRISRGGVVDYFFLPGGGAINLADIMILVGMVWLLFTRRPPAMSLIHE